MSLVPAATGETRGVDSPGTLAPAAGRAAAGRWASWARSPVLRAYAAVTGVSLLISLYLTWHLLGGFGHRMIAGNPDDVRLFVWYLRHGPWAVAHGHDPLLFTTMNAPAGVNGMWNTPLLVPALVMAPVTWLAGPLAAYNTLFVLGLATGPVCAFALLRRFAGRNWAAAAGGLVFGFSPAVLAAGLGHLDLVLIGLMPVMLLLAGDLATGLRAPLGGGLALGLAAAAQLFISAEILFQTALVLVICGALLLLTAPRLITRAALGRLARGGAAAAGVFLVICAGPLWLQLFGPLHQHGSPFTLSFFEADLRGFIVPSHRFWLSTPGSSAFAAHYGGGPAEYLAYLGVPLLLAAVATGLLRITDVRARLLLGTGLVFALFSLGSPLLVNGQLTAVRLPWGIAEHWPVFGSALPGRFAFVVALAAAGLLAMGLDWLLGHGGRAGQVLAAVVAAACLAPLAARPYPVTPASRIPVFFNAITRWLPAGRTVVVLPYPTATQTQPLAWQAAADMAFQMPGGYFIGPAPGGQAYMEGPGPAPTASTFIGVGHGAAAPAVTPAVRAQFRRDMAYWRASAIVAGPGTSPALVSFVRQLTGRAPARVAGVLLWRRP
ncbi:MAG TPA: hypothetical protein VMH35_17135 [Streptosporangiaceae bacterium]|nr:hypothetical protein [Streptosporangiaceae bacterium]